MKLRVFQSDKGDCTLITNNGKNILVDGGMTNSYNEHVSRHLNELRENGEELELVCVSHIDDDHISGILKMIEDEVDWRVYDYHKSNDTANKAPKVFRPAHVKEIWHNAFYDYVSKNKGDVEKMLAANASILSMATDPSLAIEGGIAFSKAQAIQLSTRLRADQLGIKLNARFGGKLAMYRNNQNGFTIAGLKISIIAPFKEDLDKLRDEWNQWLADNKKQVNEIRAMAKKDAPFLGSSAENQAIALANILGDRSKVTTPNLASIMFLVEDGSKTLLMTGDGHSADILKGLEKIGKLDPTKGLHLDVLKVQHHGSEHNIDKDFCRLITADNYIFCGNGFSGNPELEVLSAIIKARVSTGSGKAITSKAGNGFKFWFNSSSKLSANYKAHMKEVESLMAAQSKKYPKLKYSFMADSADFFEFSI